MHTAADTADMPANADGVSATSALVDEARHRAHDADQGVRRFVAARPLVALGLALTGGFVVGRLLQRL